MQPNADSAPAYLPHVAFAHGVHRSVVYALAANNTSDCHTSDPVTRATLYAFDAATGKTLWTRSTTGPSRCTTAGPVVDPSGRWIYAVGLDGKVHRYAAASGTETRGHGWPITVTLMPDVEKVSATPAIHNGYLYVSTSGFIGDQGHYEGHLVTIDLASGTDHVFNTLCSTVHQLLGPTPGRAKYCSYVESGLFGRGQGVADPVTHDVYIVSGNGPWNGRTNWGDSILKLDPSGTHLLDTFTPTDQAYLANTDQDLGSTGPALLPTVTQGGRHYHLLVQGGKGPACDNCRGTVLRLLDRDNLSGQGGPGHLGGDLQDITTPGGCEVLTAPAVWKLAGQIWVFYADDCGVAGYRLASPSPGKFRLQQVWSVGQGGTTPIISGGVLYVASNNTVTAYNPRNHNILATAGIGSLHWEYPLVAGGRLYISDEGGHLTAFSLR